MAFTRFNDDPCRIKKQLQESTDVGRYMLNVPGPGYSLGFANNPFVRMQKFGGNVRTNILGINNELKGISRKLNRDCNGVNNYDLNPTPSCLKEFTVNDSNTEQSRSIMPAWDLRDKEFVRWNYLHFDPQQNLSLIHI